MTHRGRFGHWDIWISCLFRISCFASAARGPRDRGADFEFASWLYPRFVETSVPGWGMSFRKVPASRRDVSVWPGASAPGRRCPDRSRSCLRPEGTSVFGRGRQPPEGVVQIEEPQRGERSAGVIHEPELSNCLCHERAPALASRRTPTKTFPVSWGYRREPGWQPGRREWPGRPYSPGRGCGADTCLVWVRPESQGKLVSLDSCGLSEARGVRLAGWLRGVQCFTVGAAACGTVHRGTGSASQDVIVQRGIDDVAQEAWCGV